MGASRIGTTTVALCLVASITGGGCGSGASSWVVNRDGRIGPLKIDVSTESDVRDFAGKPFKVQKLVSEANGDPVGYELYYHCGRRCVTVYDIAYSTGKLSDFTTESAQFVSEHGSYIGMSARQASAAERRPIVGACGEGHAIYLRQDKHHTFALGVFGRKVSLITYLGPHTLSYEELC